MPYESHPLIVTPPDDTVLWRYMDFPRFLDMIERRLLWFSRADKLDDPREGAWTNAELEHFRNLFPVPTPSGPTGEQFLQVAKFARATNYLSSWRAGAEESMAMWDVYRRSSVVVAVKSNVGLLKEAVAGFKKPVFIGEVKYIDWDQASWNVNIIAMCARKTLAYMHESEVRAMIWLSDQGIGEVLATGPVGLELPFDPERLITEVVIGPREEMWIRTLVERIMRRYQLSQHVTSSDLLRQRL